MILRALAWLALLTGLLCLAGPLFRARVQEQRLARLVLEHERLAESHYGLTVWVVEHSTRLMERIEKRTK